MSKPQKYCNLVIELKPLVVPDLEPCFQCGRQVLTSRHSWSNKLVICKTCEQFNIQKSFDERDKEFDTSSLEFKPKSNLASVSEKVKSFIPLKPVAAHEEILVTWSSLLKVSFGGILLVLLFASVLISRQKSTQFEIELTPSTDNNSRRN